VSWLVVLLPLLKIPEEAKGSASAVLCLPHLFVAIFVSKWMI
jgi:hypothetical protein